MPVYANLSGRSGVVSWEETDDSIEITFRDGSRYLYTRESLGSMDAVNILKGYADAGRGLNGYITKYVKKRYARKR
jgi:hypothetical protein